MEYAGLATEAYASGHQPQMDGTVTERPLKDGTAEVTVLLHTKNANVWVTDLDLTGDVLDQIANKPTLFGHRPADVASGEAQALADSLLHVVFINSKPQARLPDLMEINGTPAMKFLAFSSSGRGPLTADFGVPEGTPGKASIVQTGLFMTKAKGGPIVYDGFPVEDINLTVIGK